MGGAADIGADLGVALEWIREPTDWSSRSRRWRRWWTGPKGVSWSWSEARGGFMGGGGLWRRNKKCSWRRKLGGAKRMMAVVLAASLVSQAGAIGMGGGAIEELNGGWILKRAEEMALVRCYGKLLRLGSEFQYKLRLAVELEQHHGNCILHAESGQILRGCDKVQLMILNTIRSKTRCMNCHAWVNICK